MNIQTLTAFFKWCTMVNGTLLVLGIVVFMVAPGAGYQVQAIMFPLTQESFNAVMYASLGLFKILFLIFNIVPYAALRIVGKNG